MQDLKHSAHAKLQCVQCHTETRINHSLHPGNATEFRVDCVSCHQRQAKDYAMSSHALSSTIKLAPAVMAGSSRQRPQCIDCHGAHRILKVSDPSSSTARQNSVQLCVRCHAQDAAVSYFDSYHGKAYQLGPTTTATCTDCHRSHSILPSSDVRSSIASGNLKATCKPCHQSATESFTRFNPHAQSDNRTSFARLFYVSAAMHALMFATLGFFLLHLLLWLPRSIAEVRLRNKGKTLASTTDENASEPCEASKQEAD